MKPVRLSRHAKQQCVERGATPDEVREAVAKGARQPAKLGREICRFNFPFQGEWQGKTCAIKQVAPVIKEEAEEIVFFTVYPFYF